MFVVALFSAFFCRFFACLRFSRVIYQGRENRAFLGRFSRCFQSLGKRRSVYAVAGRQPSAVHGGAAMESGKKSRKK